MVLASVLELLRAAPAASDKTASFPARPWTAVVRQSPWILMGMPLPAANATKHSCATTAEVEILLTQLGTPAPAHVENYNARLLFNPGVKLSMIASSIQVPTSTINENERQKKRF